MAHGYGSVVSPSLQPDPGGHRPRGALPTTPPPDAVSPARGPNAPAPGEPIPVHYRWCLGCGSDEPAGLHLRITAGEGLSVTSDLDVTEHHQGAPGLAHGGVLAFALDEVLGSLNWLLSATTVTGRLEVDFRRPVPVGSRLRIDAEVVGIKGRKVFMRAVGRLGGPDGPLAVTATALFIQVPLAHFVDSAPGEFIQRAIDDRAAGGPAWRSAKESSAIEVNP